MSDAPRSRVRAVGLWERYWFGEASLRRLAAFRVAMMWIAFSATFRFLPSILQAADGIGGSFVERQWRPILLIEWLGIGPPDPVWSRVHLALLLAALVLAAMGWGTRVACAAAAFLAITWIGTAYSLGKPHHDCIALALGLASLPLAPVGARGSVDAWLAAHRRRRAGEPTALPERAAGAAIPWRFTQWTIAIGYCAAGVSKLAIGGLDWLNGYSLQAHILSFDTPWGEAFAAHRTFVQLSSIALVAVQVLFPLALWPRARWVLLPLGVSFHLLAWQVMDTGPFHTLWLTYVAFVPLERVPATLRAWIGTGSSVKRVLAFSASLAIATGLLAVWSIGVRAWGIGLALFVVALAIVVRRSLAAGERDAASARSPAQTP